MDARGRPTVYTDDVATEICRRLAEGETLKRICRTEGMPAESTVRHWALEDRDGFFARYAKARDLGLDCMADDVLDIADDGSNDTYLDDDGNPRVNNDVVARSRLRVDTRKWYLAKLAPKRYSDRVLNEHSGPDGGPIQTDDVSYLTDAERAQRLAALLQRAGARRDRSASDGGAPDLGAADGRGLPGHSDPAAEGAGKPG
jgi:hypothetical protein